jgi:hypothetical protein
VVDRTREHAGELRCAHTGHERREESLGLGDRRVVFLGGAEVEEDFGVVDVAPELLEGLDGLLGDRTPACEGLGLLRVVPEPRGERLFSEALDFLLQLREVKGAPLAP